MRAFSVGPLSDPPGAPVFLACRFLFFLAALLRPPPAALKETVENTGLPAKSSQNIGFDIGLAQ